MTSAPEFAPVIPTNSYNYNFDRGNADFDVRHTLTDYVVYTLPAFSHGPKRLVQGWQVNSVMTFYSGLPLTAYSGLNVSGTFEGRDRVNLIGDPYAGAGTNIITNPDGTKYVQFLNVAAFAQPAPGTFGNLGRNTLRGPGFADVDFAAVKNTAITERVSLQFRAEMFNLFNRVNLPIPGSGGASHDLASGHAIKHQQLRAHHNDYGRLQRRTWNRGRRTLQRSTRVEAALLRTTTGRYYLLDRQPHRE